ncbi:MAG: alpha/beta hydrolase family protein [Acidimicrobiales bacterium]
MRRLASLVLVVAVGTSACSTTDTSTPAPPTTGGDVTTTSAATTTTLALATEGPFAVGRRTIELVDTTRPSAADPARDLPEEPQRAFDVLVLYPASGDVPTETSPVDDAPAATGSFPLVVFTHGVTATGPVYEGRLREWARAGYVVAAPTYPRSSGPGGQISDYVHQPADVSFVLDELLDLPADDPLADTIDPEQLAAAGHSLGAITTLGVSLNSCCADERLDAAIQISGIRLAFPDGEFDDLGRVPFLAIHGAEDAVVPVSGSDSLFDEAPGPAHYLRLPDGDHSSFLFTEGELVDRVVIAFLDHYVRQVPDALDPVEAEVAASGLATFESKEP